jgi:hypothetical protein
MTKLKVGDRVRAYRSFKSYVGKIIGVENGLVTLMCDEDKNGRSFHPKQCRRLKVRSTPKAKKVTRELWMYQRPSGIWAETAEENPAGVLFREVLK